MRTISKKTKYGLQAMLALSRLYGQKPVLIAALAKQENIPVKFLEAILAELKGFGLLDSKTGPGGGYRMIQPPSEIKVGSLLRLLEGPLAPLPCASETAYKPCEDCRDVACCGTRIVMRQVRDAIANVLDRTTLADVIAVVDSQKRNQSLPQELMYYI